MASITELIERVDRGDPTARDALFATAYEELRKLARSRLRGGGRNTVLGTTALVHETYLRYLRSDQLRPEHRRAFFAYCAKVMRSVIVDAVRERQAERRNGGIAELTLDTQSIADTPSGEAEILNIHETLLALEEAEPELARIVEMRYFGGYSDVEIAEALELNERTVRRRWDKARLLLLASLRS